MRFQTDMFAIRRRGVSMFFDGCHACLCLTIYQSLMLHACESGQLVVPEQPNDFMSPVPAQLTCPSPLFALALSLLFLRKCSAKVQLKSVRYSNPGLYTYEDNIELVLFTLTFLTKLITRRTNWMNLLSESLHMSSMTPSHLNSSHFP